ncbi:UvrD-helicase domain-containing protein [Vreelandella massiliensis]|uniref:UvrD-helicase domain-containing protein n=1 Tax=Vreelandella massiliensis TaxID=1816686 RepID=UPI00096A8533|nr:UvrD-helicase domain-containing protein [Halomonas massiliensis]
MSHALTEEQQPVANFKGQKLVVKAYAGTGKTTTLVAFAKANPDARILYVAYNRAIREDAQARFPSNVTCKTTHQLAYAAIGKDYRHKLSPNLRLRDITDAVNTFDWSLAQDIRATIHAFAISADKTIDRHHWPISLDATSKAKDRQAIVIHHAKRLWKAMCDVENREVSMTHDGYFKLYQLSQPDLSSRYDIVLLDEAQDSNPCAEAIVIDQPRCRVLLAGDPYQAIYQWRGAQDAMASHRVKDAKVMRIATSFRFGERISATANALLALRGEKVPLRGLSQRQDCVIPSNQFQLKQSPVPQVTFLARTMMGVMQTALHFSRRKLSVHLVGGGDSYPLADMEDLFWLSRNKRDHIRNKQLLRDFNDFTQYKAIAEETKDPEMLRAIKVLDTYPHFDQEMKMLEKRLSASPDDADIVVTTAHRAKGLEWECVYLVDDFPDLFDDLDPAERDAEINLMYVAATRAKTLLAINTQLQKVVTRHNRAKGLSAA